MRKLLTICLSSVLLSNQLLAGHFTKKPLKHLHAVKHLLKIDSEKVALRNFDNNAIKKYSNDPAFNYNLEEQQKGLSIWDRFWRWFWHWLENLFPDAPAGKYSAVFLQYFIVAVAAVLLIYLILHLLKIDLIGLLRKRKNEPRIVGTEMVENIHEINFTDAIEQALSVRNYRLAVRLLYLQALKQLSDAGLIHWQLEKTNTMYLNELNDGLQKQSFKLLTKQFEYIWYGDFPIDGNLFHNINSSFGDFKQMIT